jgi:hypothetical protein
VDLTERIIFNLLKPQHADGLATIMRQASCTSCGSIPSKSGGGG